MFKMNESHHIINLMCSHFLDTVAQLQKVTSFIMSVCPYGTTLLPPDGFS